MLKLSVERLDNLIRRAPLLIFAGFAIGGLASFTDFGIVVAFHLVALGAGLRCIESYRSERGIWMLSVLFGGLFLVVAATLEIYGIIDAFRGAPQPNWSIVLDVAIALQLQWLMVRVHWSVFVYNRRLTS